MVSTGDPAGGSEAGLSLLVLGLAWLARLQDASGAAVDANVSGAAGLLVMSLPLLNAGDFLDQQYLDQNSCWTLDPGPAAAGVHVRALLSVKQPDKNLSAQEVIRDV